MRLRAFLATLCLAAMAPAQPANAIWATNAAGTTRSISKIDPVGRIVTTVPFATFTPFVLAIDPFGNVWAGSNGTTVTKLDSIGNVLGTFTVGSFPQSVASDAVGNLWVANRTSNSVMKLDTAGNVLTTTPLVGAPSPIGLVVDQTSNVWVSGFHANTSTTHSLFKLDSAGTVLTTYSYVTGTPGFGFSFPSLDLGNDLWVGNQARASLMQIDQAGNILSEAPLGAGFARGCQVDGLGFGWIAMQGGGTCAKVDQGGVVVASFAPVLTSFNTCAIDGNGDPWVFGSGNGTATKLWQVDGTQLVRVSIPSGGSAWGGDVGAFHLSANLHPGSDFDGDLASNLDEVTAGTNPLDVNSTPTRPLPIQSVVATPGASVKIGLRHRSDAGLVYVMGASFGTSPGIPVDTRVIPLNVDQLLLFALTTPAIFANFQGVLNGTGDALATINLPAVVPVGFSFYVAYVTLDPAAPSGIRRISNPLNITVQ